ncbi:MAG: hypothetical protein IPK19_13220 [Chloroflexi bacterium]|nr:hypothetical protein [Chloroflexota bacterium]
MLGYNFSTGFRLRQRALCGWMTVLAVYGIGRAIFDRNTALLGMLVFACFPAAHPFQPGGHGSDWRSAVRHHGG